MTACAQKETCRACLGGQYCAWDGDASPARCVAPPPPRPPAAPPPPPPPYTCAEVGAPALLQDLYQALCAQQASCAACTGSVQYCAWGDVERPADC